MWFNGFLSPHHRPTMPAIHTWLQAQTEQIDDKQSKTKVQTELIKSVLSIDFTALAVENNTWGLFY